MKIDGYVCDRCAARKETGEELPIGWIERERTYCDHDREVRAHSVMHFCSSCAKLYIQTLTDRGEWM